MSLHVCPNPQNTTPPRANSRCKPWTLGDGDVSVVTNAQPVGVLMMAGIVRGGASGIQETSAPSS